MHLLVLTALTLLSTSVHAQWRAVDYPVSGASLGAGWNSLISAQADAFCVDFNQGQEGSQVLAVQTKDFRLTEKLTRATNVSAEVKANVAVASGSVKATFIDSYSYSIEDQSFYVLARVQNEPEVAEAQQELPLRIKLRYVEMLQQPGGLTQFFKECGDSFVLRRFGGAELVALTTIKNLAEEQKSDIKLEYSAAAGNVVLGLSGALNDQATKDRLEVTTKFEYVLSGGTGATGASDRAGLAPLISQLPALAKTGPKFWQLDVRRYDTLSNWPEGTLQPAHETRLRLATAMVARLQQLESVAYSALTRPREFIPRSIFKDDIELIVTDSREKMSVLSTQMTACSRDVKACEALPVRDTTDYYWYYTRLPLRRGANLFDVNKMALENDRVAKQLALDEALSKHDASYRGPPIPRDCTVLLAPPAPPPGSGTIAVVPGMGPHPLLVAVFEACRAYQHANRQLSAASPEAEERAIKATVAQRWLRGLSREACELEKAHPMCLEPKALAEWESAIAARTYGWCKPSTDVIAACTRAFDPLIQGILSSSIDRAPRTMK